MRELTLHHDGHGLNERIHVFADDEPGPGGAHHLYRFGVDVEDPDDPLGQIVSGGWLQFQKGPRDEPGSKAGVTDGAVLAVLIDRLEAFQAGEFPSGEGADALTHLKKALDYLKWRADARAARGVLGKAQP